MILILIAVAILARNLPLALRPFFRPPAERRYSAAIVPMTTVILAVMFLVLVLQNLNSNLITWPFW